MVMWQVPRSDRVLKIVLTVVQKDFSNTSKNSYWLDLPFFSRIFFLVTTKHAEGKRNQKRSLEIKRRWFVYVEQIFSFPPQNFEGSQLA